MYHYKSCGLDNIYLVNGFDVHETADGKTYGIHNFDELHKAIAIGIAKKAAPLTGKEFRFLRVELDLSQKSMGDLMEKSEQTIANWEKGNRRISRLADAAIRNLYLDSIGEGEIGGLLKKLAQLDRRIHEYQLQLEETKEGWKLKECA
jgi:putative transcriptional regulator